MRRRSAAESWVMRDDDPPIGAGRVAARILRRGDPVVRVFELAPKEDGFVPKEVGFVPKEVVLVPKEEF